MFREEQVKVTKKTADMGRRGVDHGLIDVWRQDAMDPAPNMPYVMIGNNAVWFATADTGKTVLPSAGETAAISLRVKTAALCYDRVWAPSDNVVPDDIRVWGGSDAEVGGEGIAVR